MRLCSLATSKCYHAGFLDGPPPITLLDSGLPHVMVRDLTWDGHEFADALKNEGVWNKIRQSFSAEQLSSRPFAALKAQRSVS
jgi:hypothetical protein